MTFKAAACALCIGLACSPAAVLASSPPLKSSRSLQVTEPVEVPGTFNAGDVLNAKKDLVLLKPDKFGYFGTIVLGSSAVYTLKVDKAGTYPVTYALTGTCCATAVTLQRCVRICMQKRAVHAQPPCGRTLLRMFVELHYAVVQDPLITLHTMCIAHQLL
jgi:hypothetical protein